MSREYQLDGSTYVNEITDDEYQVEDTYINETVAPPVVDVFTPRVIVF